MGIALIRKKGPNVKFIQLTDWNTNTKVWINAANITGFVAAYREGAKPEDKPKGTAVYTVADSGNPFLVTEPVELIATLMPH